MARHVHMFYKQEVQAKSKYIWKCANCSWFVHAGLEHVLVGKTAICWNCEDTFTVAATMLEQDKIKCINCQTSYVEVIDSDEPEPVVEQREETELEKTQRELRESILKDVMSARKKKYV